MAYKTRAEYIEDNKKLQAIIDDIFESAKIGGAVLRGTILVHGGPVTDLYSEHLSRVITTSVAWRMSESIQGRSSLTDAERALSMSVDALLKLTEDEDD